MDTQQMEKCSVQEATHVQTRKGRFAIKSKYGIGPNRELAPPSKGGFGVYTELGKVTMWQAVAYWRETK